MGKKRTWDEVYIVQECFVEDTPHKAGTQWVKLLNSAHCCTYDLLCSRNRYNSLVGELIFVYIVVKTVYMFTFVTRSF